MREQQPPTTLPFLRCGGWAREAGGGEGEMGGVTRLGSGVEAGGGPVVVLGHEGGSSTRAEGSEVERLTWRTPGYA